MAKLDGRYFWRVVDFHMLPSDMHYLTVCKDPFIEMERIGSQARTRRIRQIDFQNDLISYGTESLSLNVIDIQKSIDDANHVRNLFQTFFLRTDSLYLDEDQKEQITKERKKTYPYLVDPNGTVHDLSNQSITVFARQNGLVQSCIYSLLSGQITNYLGWQVIAPESRN